MAFPEKPKKQTHSIGFYPDNEGEDFEVDLDKLKAFSKKWAYVAKKRRRWRSWPTALTLLRQAAQRDLESIFHLQPKMLSRMAKTGAVEVDYGESLEVLDAAALAPWEMILNLATDRYRSGSLLVVTRCLCRMCPQAAPSEKQAAKEGRPRNLVIVSSAPGNLAKAFAFDIEIKLLKESFPERGIDHIKDPNLKQIAENISVAPDTVIHFTGVDEIEGRQLLLPLSNDPEGLPKEIPAPGFYLATEDDDEIVVSAEDLAKALASRDCRPFLVAFNCYNSASHLASRAVCHGVHYGVGIQDRLDNPLLEKFFANFYRTWIELDTAAAPEKRGNPLHLLKAFWTSILTLQGQSNFGYVVLWSDAPLRGYFKDLYDSLKTDPREKRESKPAKPTAGAVDDDDTIEVDVRPFRDLNYSMLHNHRSMFQRFVVKAKKKFAPGVQVEVTLNAKGESYRYKTTCDVKDYFHKLDQIQVSLTSALLRTLRESIYTTLYVRVTYQKKVVAEVTEKVRLLPVNEWRDSPNDGVWLPSFVLSYEPAVVTIIDRAQKYLKALLDDSTASFNGYQACRPAAANGQRSSFRSGDLDCSGVHAQVRAIWSAMTYDFPLEYIAPPPSFIDQSQRIRTPSDVLAERRGTCIDLSLLLAACLEHIELRPVLFLLSGHAFPGYFSSSSAHDEFVKLFSSEDLDPDALSWRNESSPQPWVLEADAYSHIIDFVRKGELIPLESTWLTKRASFSNSYAQGRKNLSSRSRFESVHDIRRARGNGVTPLPIGGASS